MALSDQLKQEIAECLRRSGYLLESRLVRSLAGARFFVEPNVAMLDARTGKSREIDVLAEYYDYDPDRRHVSVQTYFAIEAVNNNLPFVLMTPHPGSPSDIFEEYLRYGSTPDSSSILESVDLYEEKGGDIPRYTQYCGLSRKKANDDLMASHLEDIYASLLKLAEFTENRYEEFVNHEWDADDPFWRLHFWQGILVVGGDLVTATQDEQGDLSVVEVESGTLIFNFHIREEPRSTLIHVVRERHLLELVSDVVVVDRRLRSRVHDARSAARPAP
jgi:hypothetical protein